jgi:hypothetical protein
MGGLAVFALGATYILASWAIDSGSLLVYGLTSISTIYTLYFLKEAFRLQFNNDKPKATR